MALGPPQIAECPKIDFSYFDFKGTVHKKNQLKRCPFPSRLRGQLTTKYRKMHFVKFCVLKIAYQTRKWISKRHYLIKIWLPKRHYWTGFWLSNIITGRELGSQISLPDRRAKFRAGNDILEPNFRLPITSLFYCSRIFRNGDVCKKLELNTLRFDRDMKFLSSNKNRHRLFLFYEISIAL